MTRTVVASGRVLSPARIEVGTTILGIVAQVAVEEGQVVRQGELMVTLEDDELTASVAAAEASVEQARMTLESIRRSGSPSAREALVQARLDAELADERLRRAERLTEAGVMTAADLDETRSRANTAQSRLRQAELTARARGGAGSERQAQVAALEAARANLEAARARLRRATVEAPADGVVLRREVEPGDVVQPGAVMIELARSGQNRISLPIDERNIAGIELGRRATVAAEAFPDRQFQAEIDFIAPIVEADRGTIEVRLRSLDPPEVLRVDMTVTVEIELEQRQNVLAVPVDALVAGPDGSPELLVAQQGVCVRRAVTLGERGSSLVEVVSGLRENEVVLLPGDLRLEEGQAVRPRLTNGRTES